MDGEKGVKTKWLSTTKGSAPIYFARPWDRCTTTDAGEVESFPLVHDTAVLATLRDKLRSVDVWVERSASYRCFDSYLVPQDAVPVITAELKLPATAHECLAGRSIELNGRLKRFSRRLLRGELEGRGTVRRPVACRRDVMLAHTSAAHLGAFWLLRRFPLGSRGRDCGSALTAQSELGQDDRTIDVSEPLTLSLST